MTGRHPCALCVGAHGGGAGLRALQDLALLIKIVCDDQGEKSMAVLPAQSLMHLCVGAAERSKMTLVHMAPMIAPNLSLRGTAHAELPRTLSLLQILLDTGLKASVTSLHKARRG